MTRSGFKTSQGRYPPRRIFDPPGRILDLRLWAGLIVGRACSYFVNAAAPGRVDPDANPRRIGARRILKTVLILNHEDTRQYLRARSVCCPSIVHPDLAS
jgi:hypothetical protein